MDGRMQFAHSVSFEGMNVTRKFDLRVHSCLLRVVYAGENRISYCFTKGAEGK